MTGPDNAWLRDGLAELAEQATTAVDLQAQALRTSRHLGLRRAAVTGAAGVAVLAVSATAAFGLGPREGAQPVPAFSALPAPSSPASTPSPAPPPPPAAVATSSAPAEPQRCRTADLKVRFERWAPEHQAGASRQASLSLTNTADVACTLKGFAGLQFYDKTGKPRTTDVRREGTAKRITVAPGRTAWSNLVWYGMPNADERRPGPGDTEEIDCGPVPAKVRVTPPGDVRGTTVPATVGLLCDHGKMYLTPLSLTRITSY